MPALVFEMKLSKLIKAYLRGKIKTSGYWKSGGPLSIKEVPLPKLISNDWVIVRTIYCGICGSDMKEITLSGNRDNPLQTLISFPQIMGHEPVGIIERVGSTVKNFKQGDRIVISPWFSCASRGIKPPCLRCQQGDYVHCSNFKKGQLPPGMHLGVTTGFGGFAPYIAVHESQCYLIPKNIKFEQAVLADPFSVAFHSLLTLNPNPKDIIMVYGLGVIGLLTILCLKNLFNVEKIIAIARYSFQSELALELGASKIFTSSSGQLIEEISNYLDLKLYKPEKGLKWVVDGVDGIIDTIASNETLEIGIRITRTQGKIIFLGVSTPKRVENTLHYFKELEIIGSNAFSIETFEKQSQHAFNFFLDFLSEERIDISKFVTHIFPLEDYNKAFDVLTNKKKTKAIKVLFKFNN